MAAFTDIFTDITGELKQGEVGGNRSLPFSNNKLLDWLI